MLTACICGSTQNLARTDKPVNLQSSGLPRLKKGGGGEYPESKSALESKQDPPPACLHLHRYRLTHASENSSAGKRAKSRPPARIKGLATGPQALQGEVPGSAPGGHGEEIEQEEQRWAWSAPYLASGSGCLRHLLLRTAEPLPSAPSWRRVPGMLTLPVLAIISTWCLCVCIARRGN